MVTGLGWDLSYLSVAPANLFNAMPVGLGQVKAAGGGSRLVPNHTHLGHGREAVSASGDAVLSRVQDSPVVPCWCYGEKQRFVPALFCSGLDQPGPDQSTGASEYLW